MRGFNRATAARRGVIGESGGKTKEGGDHVTRRLRLLVATAAVAVVVFALATFGVPAVYARKYGVVSSIGIGLRLLRENRVAMGGWALVLVSVAALAAWVTPVVLVVGFPLVAYANWHAYRISRRHTAPSQHA